MAPNRRLAPRTVNGAAYKPSQRTQPLQYRGQAQVAEYDAANTACAKGGTRVPVEGRHTNLGSAHNPPGTAKRTKNPCDQECRQ